MVDLLLSERARCTRAIVGRALPRSARMNFFKRQDETRRASRAAGGAVRAGGIAVVAAVDLLVAFVFTSMQDAIAEWHYSHRARRNG